MTNIPYLSFIQFEIEYGVAHWIEKLLEVLYMQACLVSMFCDVVQFGSATHIHQSFIYQNFYDEIYPAHIILSALYGTLLKQH